MYAFRGIIGRAAPIAVHVGMVIVLLGATVGALGSWNGDLMMIPGVRYSVGEVMSPSSPFARLPDGANMAIRLKK